MPGTTGPHSLQRVRVSPSKRYDTMLVVTQTIYRIENLDTQCGMWYRENGVYDPFIFKLTEGISKGLPMEFDARYHQGGDWKSATSSKEKLRHWFSSRDALELGQNGYLLYQMIVKEFQEEEFQTLFTERSVISRKVIPLEEIWSELA